MYGLLGSNNIWPRYNYLNIWNLRMQKNLNIKEITFKVVQIKFLAMHITIQNWNFDLFMVNLHNIVMEHDLYLMKNRSFWPIQCIFDYCYKYTRATYDWFCGTGSHITFMQSTHDNSHSQAVY